MTKWINDIFAAGAVNKGNRTPQQGNRPKNGGYRALLAEVKHRRFHLIRTGGPYIVICNTGIIKTLC